MSDFWLKKMKHYFKTIDFDHDGSITKKDFAGMADKFVKSGKMKDDEAKHLVVTMDALWTKYQEVLGEGGDAISEKDFLKAMTKMHKKGDSHHAAIEAPLPLFFSAVDANQDNFISKDEFKLFFGILGLTDHDSDATFAEIDTNNDGLLSKDEFTGAGLEFFTTEDEKKVTKNFWGPLDKK